MATNPQVPFERKDAGGAQGPRLVPKTKVPKRPSSAGSGILLTMIVAAVLLAVAGFYMSRAPKNTLPPAALELPQQPSGNQLQFSKLQLRPAPMGDAVTLRGEVVNNGGRPVVGTHVVLSFRDGHGQILQAVAAPMVGLAARDSALVADEFSKDPLKPNDTRPFEVTTGQVPAGWNHAMPEMKIVTVSAAGNR